MVLASRQNASANAGRAARVALMTFTATTRSSRVSYARYTRAIPPEASAASTRYRESMSSPTSGSSTYVSPTVGSLWRGSAADAPNGRRVSLPR